ncbi:histone acetyltransferase, MYST superfamily [Boletus reticuloceps]|uniref:histone acetyltransferase n=1 Tax=Boletus reticuloceps TaxID=495285 RepID=A0A8I3AAV4_9AGAM|nr:histone acetyltransferase, MYST superfamily [Boletus reticuloceps]
MVSTLTSHEGSQEPAPITPGGTYSIQTVTVGCKIYIRRPTPDGGEEERLAEILSIRDKPVNSYAAAAAAAAGRRATRGSIKEEEPEPKLEDKWEYFVHWDQFNKRLDEWVTGSRLVISRDLEWPRPKPPPGKKAGPGAQKAPGKVPRSQSLLKKATANAAAAASPTPASTPGPGTGRAGYTSPSPAPSLKRKTLHEEQEEEEEEEPEDEDLDAEGEMDIDAEGEAESDTFELSVNGTPPEPPEPVSAFSKEQEIEKLRTSGSMTQSISEIARVKNLNRLQIGKHEVDAWYFSPYPREYAHLPVLYICEFCLSYFPSSMMLSRHRRRCTMLHPPGNEIYRHEDISFFELDGKRQLTWCRNLSLLSKCFLDHKTLYYDVTPFMYYVMTLRDSTGCHIVGYFSKEKESAENYNVACILTLPQHQRHGYGKFIIEFSYELSKKEGKLGSPEKPLSDLGLLSYRAYWAEVIVELLLNATDELSVDDIAQKTSITHADVMNTCTTLQLFRHWKGQHIICLSDAVLEKHEKVRSKRRRRIHPEHLIWKPPVFTRDQLRFY